MRILAILGIALALAGCESREHARVRIEKELPPGCSFYDLQGYGQLDELVLIKCDNAQTTTTGSLEHYEPATKTFTRYSYAVSIN